MSVYIVFTFTLINFHNLFYLSFCQKDLGAKSLHLKKLTHKFITDMSRGEVSLMEQDTIKKPIKIQKIFFKFFKEIFFIG